MLNHCSILILILVISKSKLARPVKNKQGSLMDQKGNLKSKKFEEIKKFIVWNEMNCLQY